MNFNKLPNEIILSVVDFLVEQVDIYSMTCVNWRLYRLLRDTLFRHNIEFRQSKALIWAIEKDRTDVAHEILRRGGDIYTLGSLESSCLSYPLFLAAAYGKLPMVNLLLEMGADLVKSSVRNRTPLFEALKHKKEDIARALFDKMSNKNMSIILPEPGVTVLHVACVYRLPQSVRYFLEQGADVNYLTSFGTTPLNLILRPVNLKFRLTRPSLDDDLEVFMLLLNWGAECTEGDSSLGLEYPDPRVRRLFDTNSTLESTADQIVTEHSSMTSTTEGSEQISIGDVCMTRKRFLLKK